MAIRKKDDKKAPTVPAAIEQRVDSALEAGFLSDWFGDRKTELKTQAVKLIEESTEVEMVIGTGFRTHNGMIVPAQRKNIEVSTAAIEEAIRAGEITVGDVLAYVATWKKDEIQAALPSAITEKEPTIVFQLRPSAAFTKAMQEKYSDLEAMWEAFRVTVRKALAAVAAE